MPTLVVDPRNIVFLAGLDLDQHVARKEFALRLALLPGAHLDHFFHRHQNFAEAILHAGTRDALDQGALYLVFKPGKRVYHIPTLGHDSTLSLAQQRLQDRKSTRLYSSH